MKTSHGYYSCLNQYLSIFKGHDILLLIMEDRASQGRYLTAIITSFMSF